MNEPLSLGALLLSSFTSATLLPGSSELVLLAILAAGSSGVWTALGVATIGNTLGGLTSYALGRFIPRRIEGRALKWVERYGAFALLLSWVPLVGDALCVAAGWMRANLYLSVVCMALGKFIRYWLIAQLAV